MADRQSCILLDSNLSEFFSILNGVAQGDPISGYLFLLAIEIFIIMINQRYDIQYNTNAPLLKQNNNSEVFADDLMAIINWSRHSITTFNALIEKFSAISGLVMNKSKTELMAFGDTAALQIITEEQGLTVSQSLTYLGYHQN